MLELDDFKWAAEQLNCDIAVIQAVAEVESRGNGFHEGGAPKILFEAHHFSRMTAGKYDDSHPHISSERWNRKLYKGGIAEHGRLQEAASLNREAALKSASWGRFQIMGFNWAACGYASLQDFINDMYAGEFGHLKAFVGFIKSLGLQDELRKCDWDRFARVYNGPGYAANQYDTRLQQAYLKYKKHAIN